MLKFWEVQVPLGAAVVDWKGLRKRRVLYYAVFILNIHYFNAFLLLIGAICFCSLLLLIERKLPVSNCLGMFCIGFKKLNQRNAKKYH